ncbi:hypothetical protein ABBQ38_010916 [Trebouxia sp. C0009 RCD-2024]
MDPGALPAAFRRVCRVYGSLHAKWSRKCSRHAGSAPTRLQQGWQACSEEGVAGVAEARLAATIEPSDSLRTGSAFWICCQCDVSPAVRSVPKETIGLRSRNR